jgi:dTMP kinase
MFISFEGIDYSGKTTQATLLVERLKHLGKEVLFLREPGGTKISEKIREILLDKRHLEMHQKAELFLFSAARTQLVSEVIVPALKRKAMVICDRFHDSTTAYQGFGRGLDLREVESINRIATSGTIPELTLFVDIEVDEIAKRRRIAGLPEDRMESGGTEFYEHIRQGYLSIALHEPGRFIRINGARPVQEIHEEIWKIVDERMP